MMLDYLKSWPLYLLPHHFLSSLIYKLTRVRVPFIKNNLIRLYSRVLDLNLNEAKQSSPESYSNFNDFFTRKLKPEARPIHINPDHILSPVDGAISQIGLLHNNHLIQAKNHNYMLGDLLGWDPEYTPKFSNGSFTTIYLSPKDYHRIHMPAKGTLKRMTHIPGRLFSVAPHTVNTIPNVFARNERVINYFETEFGPMAVILVGAIFVGSMSTQWAGEITPSHEKAINSIDYDNPSLTFEQGEEIAQFNMGSTVILLFPERSILWLNDKKPDQKLLLGQLIANIQ